MRRVAIGDLHNDLLADVLHAEERGRPDRFSCYWLPQLRAGAVSLCVLAVFTEEQFAGEGALRRCLRTLDLAHRIAAEHADEVVLVSDRGALAGAPGAGRIELLLALEGLEPVGADLSLLRVLRRLGVTIASLTWNRRTAMADGAGESATGGGLTALGVEAVSEMERLGMLVDVSHLSDAGFWHVAEIATRPLVATHSSCRALVDHVRNLDDRQLADVAATGGVVGVNLFGGFLGPGGGVEQALRHLEHVVEVAGADHVGIGADFMADLLECTDPILGGSLVAGAVGSLLKPDLLRPADLAELGDAVAEHFGEVVARKICLQNARRVLAGCSQVEGQERTRG